ncbi:MAG: phosphoribosylglycinamide formyltransferase [Desulfobacteraceae bacterium]|nr:phosphoribosylglycinamide formyltransferase [Desulfobacteraceae bacterium]MBC2756982.1 phosphoribosylglycinamide formyltransferase [Desulfobacteraceae bacterium]
MDKKIKIGGIISGTGTNMDAIIKACEKGRIDGEVIFVGSDNPDAKGLEKAAKKGIPTFVVNYSEIIQNFKQAPENYFFPDDFNLEDIKIKQSLLNKETDAKKVSTFIETRAIAEAALLEKIKEYPFDLLVLAGFMRNLTPYFIDRVNTTPGKPRIMNIHPALLPSFPGTDGYGDTFRYGCKVGGCTVHFIDYGEDSGPIIGQRCFPITATDTIDSIKQKGLALEYQLYPECIQHFAEDRLTTVKMTVTDHKGSVSQRTVVKIAQTDIRSSDD